MSTLATQLPENSAAWKLPYRGKVGMACLILAESAIFTDFRCGLSLLPGEKLVWTDSTRSLGNPDLLHNLSALQQPDDSYRGESCSESGWLASISRLMVAQLLAILGALFLYVAPGMEWHRLIHETQAADHLDESSLEQRTTRWSACTPFTLRSD